MHQFSFFEIGQVVHFFTRRNDAREYLRVLNQLNETAIYKIVFGPLQ
ncbi:hypothetical protein ACKFKF_16685 [Phormidesmis sp. 146-12]